MHRSATPPRNRFRPLILTAAIVAGCMSGAPSVAGASIPTSPVSRIIVEPDAGYGFMDQALMGARSSIDGSFYELRDPTVEQILAKEADHGVSVHLVLNAAYRGISENTAAVQFLESHHVHVTWAPAGQIFHAKYAVIDRTVAYIGTGNLVASDYSSTRDFWVVDRNPSDLRAIMTTVVNDERSTGTPPASSNGLVWSPGSTSQLVAVIAEARTTLLVENEEMKNTAIESALSSAARRGVHVTVVMTRSSSWTAALSALAGAGVTVRALPSSAIYIHAKVICADCGHGGIAFLGSENFSTYSLERNRELGLITTSPLVTSTVASIVRSDARLGSGVSGAGGAGSRGGGTSGGAVRGLAVTSFLSSISRGAYDTLSVKTAPNASCDLEVTLPSGYQSGSHGLGSATASSGGVASWTWKIGSSTHPGTATATVQCGTAKLSQNFSIT